MIESNGRERRDSLSQWQENWRVSVVRDGRLWIRKTYVAFRDAPTQKTLWRYRTFPTPQTAKRPTFNADASAPQLHIIGRAIGGNRPRHAHDSPSSSDKCEGKIACRCRTGWFAVGVTLHSSWITGRSGRQVSNAARFLCASPQVDFRNTFSRSFSAAGYPTPGAHKKIPPPEIIHPAFALL